MRRRSFLVQVAGTVVGTPILLSITSCASDDGSGGGGGGETVNGFVVNNTDASSHTHQFTVVCDDEGAASATYTATGSGHTHSVALSQQDLTDIFAGREVTKETSDLHAHTWVIQMPAAGCTAVPNDDDDPPDDGGW